MGSMGVISRRWVCLVGIDGCGYQEVGVVKMYRYGSGCCNVVRR